nr:cilia- and flagella-associated protein 61-like [Salvelinus alpinus]
MRTCIISVPKLPPEFSLLQVVPHHTSSLPQELYIFHCSGLLKTFDMRLAVSADRPAVCDMVKRLSLHVALLEDVDMFFKANRDMHYAEHFPKEALQLAHKSCLYHPVYPSYHSQRNSCAHYLTSVLNCMVPVRPRRQIVYPLDELGVNTPSKQITKDQVGTAAAGGHVLTCQGMQNGKYPLSPG